MDHPDHHAAVDPAYLNPHSGFVVMLDDQHNAVEDARLALDALVSFCHSAANAEYRMRKRCGDDVGGYIEVPPESLAALLGMITEKLEPAAAGVTLSALRKARPDLFEEREERP